MPSESLHTPLGGDDPVYHLGCDYEEGAVQVAWGYLQLHCEVEGMQLGKVIRIGKHDRSDMAWVYEEACGMDARCRHYYKLRPELQADLDRFWRETRPVHHTHAVHATPLTGPVDTLVPGVGAEDRASATAYVHFTLNRTKIEVATVQLAMPFQVPGDPVSQRQLDITLENGLQALRECHRFASEMTGD